MDINLQQASRTHIIALQDIFVKSISVLCTSDYSPEQRNAWLMGVHNQLRWNALIASQYVVMANCNNQPAGFISVNYNEYIDMLYVHPDYAHKGVASSLLNHVIAFAVGNRVEKMATHASKTALPFFQKNGFTMISVNNVTRYQVPLVNYYMERKLIGEKLNAD